MQRSAMVFILFLICFYSPGVLGAAVSEKTPVDWWCDETECYYSDNIPSIEKCDTNRIIPYRFDNATGLCELNIKGLLLVLQHRLGKMAIEKNRKRTERILHGVMLSGKMFIIFASICTCVGCFYCCWVHYTDRRLKKNVKEIAKKLRAQSQAKKSELNTRNGKKENDGVEKIQESEVMSGVEVSVV